MQQQFNTKVCKAFFSLIKKVWKCLKLNNLDLSGDLF